MKNYHYINVSKILLILSIIFFIIDLSVILFIVNKQKQLNKYYDHLQEQYIMLNNIYSLANKQSKIIHDSTEYLLNHVYNASREDLDSILIISEQISEITGDNNEQTKNKKQ